MVSSIKASGTTCDTPLEEGGLHTEDSRSFLSTISSLLNYFTPAKQPAKAPSPPRAIGIGTEHYEELHRHIAAVRYELISLRAQITAFEKMDAWSQRVDLKTLRRPDLEKVGRRLQAKEEELQRLLADQEIMYKANLQHVKIEALYFEEDYLRYLITEILEKGDPQSPLTSELISALGTLKKDLVVEQERLEYLRVVPQIDGPITPPSVN